MAQSESPLKSSFNVWVNLLLRNNWLGLTIKCTVELLPPLCGAHLLDIIIKAFKFPGKLSCSSSILTLLSWSINYIVNQVCRSYSQGLLCCRVMSLWGSFLPGYFIFDTTCKFSHPSEILQPRWYYTFSHTLQYNWQSCNVLS